MFIIGGDASIFPSAYGDLKLHIAHNEQECERVEADAATNSMVPPPTKKVKKSKDGELCGDPTALRDHGKKQYYIMTGISNL